MNFKAITLALFVAVFCLLGTGAVHAQTFKHDFLYKFSSRWSDITTDGGFVYVTNSNYSQIEKYSVGGAFDHVWGTAGSGDGQFKQPMGITVATYNAPYFLYVADTGNNRIQKINASTGAYVAKWGSYGSGDGQFDHPQGIAVDGLETWAFIADTGNNRIQALDLSGGTLYATGSAATAPGPGDGLYRFSSPKGIAVLGTAPDFAVFVADTGNNRVVKYNFNTVSHEFTTTVNDQFGSYGTTSSVGSIRFNQPNKIILDGVLPYAYLYVTDSTNRIQRILTDYTFDKQWNVNSLKGTTGIACYMSGANPIIYAVEPYNQVDVYAGATGSYSSSFTYEANEPVDVALDPSGNIYINNSRTDTVTKFSSSWVPQVEWTGDTTPFDNSLGIGVNTNGEVAVADTGGNRVQRFLTDGTYVATLPDLITTPTGFLHPRDVANESTGKMYVADTDNNRIVKFSSDYPVPTEIWTIGLPTPSFALPSAGTPTPTTIAGPYFLHPYGITLDSQNKIYIADSGHHRIMKFDANGNLYDGGKNVWGEYGSADNRTEPQFDNPQGMAIGPEQPAGYIYVADTGNNRIQRFDQDGTLATRILWGEYGTGDGQFSQPRNVAVDSSSRVYVSEVTNKRIQVFGDAALSAGLSIVETSGTAVTEGSAVYDSYSVRLNTQPSSDVTVTVAASDSAQLSVSSPTLTFTPQNWNIPQVETVIPIHDFVDQQTSQQIIITHTVASADSHYQSSGISWGTVNVTLTDTDTAGVTTTPVTGKVAEMGILNDGSTGEETATYTVVLNSKPTTSVTVSATSPDGFTTISPTSTTITPDKWDTPVTFTVSAFHDDILYNPATRSANINNAITTSDTNYQAITIPALPVTVEDFYDKAGVVLDKYDLGTIDEGGSGTMFGIRLHSKPTADVTLNVATSSGTTDLNISPSSVTFTAANWNTVQQVTMTAPHDFIVNDPVFDLRAVLATASASPANADYYYQPGHVQFYLNGSYGDGTVQTTIRDIDTAGLAFTELDGTQFVISGQTTDTYTLALTSKPSGNVLLTSSSDSDATTSAHVFLFTPQNWDTPQIVVISAVNDNIDEGTHSATITFTIADSLDPAYVIGNTFASPVFTIYDSDHAGYIFDLPNGSINIQEGGYEDQYSFHLQTQPLADVTVAISGGADAVASPSSMLFTAANWNVYQIATVSAINNFIVQGAHTGTLTHTATSTDPQYNRLTTSLIMNIADDDNTVPGVLILQTDGSTTVKSDGTQDTYTMQLTSRPTSNVRIRILSDNWTSTTSAAIFTFTIYNWNVPQTVHVLPKNTVGTTDLSNVFHHLLTSIDPHYNALPVDDVFVNVINLSKPSAASAVPPSCNQPVPADTPNLFQIDAGVSSATLYYTPIKENITYYFVAYGFKPGDMRFGVSFPYSPYTGVIDYTVNMLDAGKTYYFMVRGGNGCATGNWSNSLAATTQASGSATLRSFYGGGTSGYTTGSYAGTAITAGNSADGTHPIFARDLYPGMRGADVRSLQIYLNQKGFIVAPSGAGSPGNETDYYGPLTANAVRRFQEAHYAEILSPLGYSSGTGIFGPSTRAYVNAH